jgi:hypothetical protein
MQTSMRTLVAVLVVVVLSSAARSEQPKSLSTATVVDAQGRKVGPVFSLINVPRNPIVVVAFTVETQPFVLFVFPFSMTGDSTGPFFESTDCSGPPLIEAVGISLFPSAAVSGPGHTVYLAEPDATSQFFESIGSALSMDGTCSPGARGGLMGIAARPVMELDTLFTPPFSVR